MAEHFDAQVSFTCTCGARLSWPDDAIDSTEIVCTNCGKRIGTYADLRDAAKRAAGREVASALKDEIRKALKGGNIKFK